MPPVVPRAPHVDVAGVALSQGAPHPDVLATVSLTRRYFCHTRPDLRMARAPSP